MKNAIIKGVTLLLFASLIIAFVLLKSNKSDSVDKSKKIVVSKQYVSSKTPMTDTLSVPSDVEQNLDDSTRSFQNELIQIGSVNLENELDTVILDSSITIDPLIYSSKSLILVDPNEVELYKQRFYYDSFLLDKLIDKK